MVRFAPGFSLTDELYNCDLPLPGVPPTDLQVVLANRVVKVTRAGSTSQVLVPVPQAVDVEELRVTHAHGVLRLSGPMRSDLRARELPIEAQ